jgi:hypothetical protein
MFKLLPPIQALLSEENTHFQSLSSSINISSDPIILFPFHEDNHLPKPLQSWESKTIHKGRCSHKKSENLHIPKFQEYHQWNDSPSDPLLKNQLFLLLK